MNTILHFLHETAKSADLPYGITTQTDFCCPNGEYFIAYLILAPQMAHAHCNSVECKHPLLNHIRGMVRVQREQDVTT